MLHFLKFSSLETISQIVYGQITKIGDRMKDRKLAITFKVLICPDFHWSQSMGKCSRIRFRLVSASRSIEITWFGPVLYTNFVQIEFLAKFMVFHIFFCFKTTNRTLRRRSEQQIWSISNIFKVRISQGI